MQSVKPDEPYVIIAGCYGNKYSATVWEDAHTYSYSYHRVFRSRERAEKWGKRKLDKVKRMVDHSKYRQRITLD